MKKKKALVKNTEDKQPKVKYFQSEVIKAEDGSIRLCITKQVVDRDGEVLVVDGCDLSGYAKNPIMLWGHRMMGGDIEDVTGRLNGIQKTVDANTVPMIIGIPEFADHPKAQYLKSMVERGIISTVSVGFLIKDGGYNAETRTITAWELLEVSWVTVPANPEARVQKGFKVFESDKQLAEKSYKKLINYDKIHPAVKLFRKLFLSDEVCDKIAYTKTGDELVDVKNVYDLLIKDITSAKETPNAGDTKPKNSEYVTKADVEEAFEGFRKMFKNIK